MLYCMTQDCERKELKPGYAVTAEKGMENSPTQPASFPRLSLNSALVDHSSAKRLLSLSLYTVIFKT